MKLGFSQQIITPKHPCMLAGYDTKRVMSGIHDDLYVKVLVMEYQNHIYALIVFDLIAVDELLKQHISTQLEADSLRLDHLFFCATHTHSGPMGVLDTTHGYLKSTVSFMGEIDQAYISHCSDMTIKALYDAYEMLEEGSLSIAKGQGKGIGSNRNDPTLSGNDELCLIQASCGNHKALITIYSCHPTILDATNTECSADLCGAYASKIEQQGYDVSIFLNGSCGDISTRFTRVGHGFDEVERIAGVLAKQSLALCASMRQLSLQQCRHTTLTIQLKGKIPKSKEEVKKQIKAIQTQLSNAISQGIAGSSKRLLEAHMEAAKADARYALYHQGNKQYEVRVELIQVDQEILIGIPGELFSELSNPYRDGYTHVIGYMNGYHMYFANQSAYEKQYYEAACSPFAKGESEELMKQINELIKEWRKTV